MSVTYFEQQKLLKRFDKMVTKNTFSNFTQNEAGVIKIDISNRQKAEFIAVQSLFIAADASVIDKARGIGGRIAIIYHKEERRLVVTVYGPNEKQAPLSKIAVHGNARSTEAA